MDQAENKKSIDESWKKTVEKEKDAPAKPEENFIPEVPDFKFFTTTLALQAAIFLGQIDNPVTNKKEENLPQAKFIIDTLDMLKEKTKGNLSPDELSMLENILYELKLQYIEKTKGK